MQINQAETTGATIVQLFSNPNGIDDWDTAGNGVGEYFLVEYRRLTGYDSNLPGEGLLIWHIDESRGNNNDETHKFIDLEEADGRNDLDTLANRGDAGDPYVSNVAGFTFTTNPNSNLYNGNLGLVNVTNIGATGGTSMTADFWFVKPQLEIPKTAAPSTIFVGESATVTVTANNVGNTVANTPHLYDTVPSGLTVTSGSTGASANYIWGTAAPPSVDVYVHDTNTWINSSEARWCRITQLDAGTWRYSFEDRKGQIFADYDFNQPQLTVRKEGDFYSATMDRYDGSYLIDVYVGGMLTWSNAGRWWEQWGVGQTRAAPPILLMIRDSVTGEYVQYHDAQRVRVSRVAVDTWVYDFEVFGILPSVPGHLLLRAQRATDGTLAVTLQGHTGLHPSDIFLQNHETDVLLWSNAGGTEQNHVGETQTVSGYILRWCSVLPSLTYSYTVRGDHPDNYMIPTEAFYYGGVAESVSYTASASVTIEVREGDAGVPGDAGNTIAQARAITPGDYWGYFGPDDPSDFYSIQSPSGLLSASMAPGSDYDIYLYDAGQNLLAKSENRGDADEEITYAVKTPGQYFLEVRKVEGFGPYTFSVEIEPELPVVAVGPGLSSPAV
ncbi:MAG: hypothetical protein AB1744_10810, partial [Candidatus Zixiibacteriota bacterium]